MQALTLDAAGTLFDLAEPVGTVYARLAAQSGYHLEANSLDRRFRETFPRQSAPAYVDDCPGHVTERSWWRELVLKTTELADNERFEDFFNAAFAFYESPAAWQLFPDTIPFLDQAASHYRLAVVSNFDARLHPIIAGLGLGSYFEKVISSADAKSRKPDSAIFQRTLAELALPAHQICHIGDSEVADYRGARSAGLHAIHLRRPAETLLSTLPVLPQILPHPESLS